MRNQERLLIQPSNFPHPHTQQLKFAHSIQQLQSKIEGVENLVKAKISSN
jgi:hypothetical protein